MLIGQRAMHICDLTRVLVDEFLHKTQNQRTRFFFPHWYLAIATTSYSINQSTRNCSGSLRKRKNIEDITWPRGDTKFLFEC